MNLLDRISSGFTSLFKRDDEKEKDAIPSFEHWDKPEATPKQKVVTPEEVEAGIRKFDASSPLLQFTQELSDAANAMPKKADRWLPVVMAIMETGAGVKLSAANNPFNLRGEQGGRTKFIDYPDIPTAIRGGDNNGVKSKGFVGTLNESTHYEQYRQTGNLEDFFAKFTPPGKEYGNPSVEELTGRYNSIKKDYFETPAEPSARILGDDRKKRIDELSRRARLY